MNRKEIAVYFLILLALFALSIFSGYQEAKRNPIKAESVVHQFSSEFGFVKRLPSYAVFALIFLNNSIKAFVVMILGSLFGIAPIFFVFINGYLIGLVTYAVGLKIGMRKVVMMLVPHGVIEIPAVILACSYGLWLGRMFFKKITGDNVSMSECIKEAIRVFFKTVVPMLIIAAFVETFITPRIA